MNGKSRFLHRGIALATGLWFLLAGAPWAPAANIRLDRPATASAENGSDPTGVEADYLQEQAASPHQQSPEVRAFRRTAIPVTFPSNGLELKGWLYKPQGDGPFPAVIWNHGSERNVIAHPELGLFYTSHGYVLFVPVRHGHNPSPGDYIGDMVDRFKAEGHSLAQINQYQAAIQEVYNQDVVAAFDWLKSQLFVDPSRLVVTGCSYGGIQTLLTAQKGLGIKAAIPCAPGAMSWGNTELQKREIEAVRKAQMPIFLLQAENDYSIGPSEVLGPIITAKGGANRAKMYPAFGTTHQEGHAGFACWQEGTAIWGPAVLDFLNAAGAGATSGAARKK